MESIFHWSITTLLDSLHWGTSIFWKEIRLILHIVASDGWYRDHWIVSCCPHCILEHSHLIRCFDIETWLSIYDCCFRQIMEYWHLRFNLLSILGWSRISTYLLFRTQTFHLWYFHASYLTRVWSLPSFISHILPWRMTSHPSLD